MNAHDEYQLLLGTGTSPESDQMEPTSKSQKLTVMIAACTLVLAMDFGFYLTAAPQTEVFENIICQNYMAALGEHADKTSTEDICKSKPVQSELALVNGWKDTSDVLAGILLSVPYGVLADRWGRKPVLLLGILGGSSWGNLGPYCIATALFRITSATLLAEALATPVSAYLMTRDPWIPYMLGLGIATLGAFSAYFMPETLSKAKPETSTETRLANEETQSQDSQSTSKYYSIRRFIIGKLRDLQRSTRFIMGNPDISACLFVVFITSITKQSTSLLLQFTSKRFHMTIAKASLLISVRGSITLANFIVLMPAVSFLITRYFHLEGNLRDLRLAQILCLISALGFIIMSEAISWAMLIMGVVLLSLGAAFAVFGRSFMTSLVPSEHIGTLYSSAAALTSLGMMISGPFLAYMFRWGLELGRSWLGLPFILAGALYFLGFGFLIWLKVPQADDVCEE
ncbi:MFS general substrate transporter [Penicillium malachiteum]|uniref:MFS general substrate transporter n=1 Tax=Penicillium malachiteum TaxID=1324776 RepID=UPI002548A467|nr:MFS general substrate transporter [Penicillium malachiteum]KAJ5720497.1 MFS general substrate transporter [Penicillium malachiteum]